MSEREDLRLVPAALAAWAAMWVATSGQHLLVVGAGVAAALAALAALLRRSWTWGAVALVVAACLLSGCWRATELREGAVGRAADERAAATVHLRVDADPRPVQGRFGEMVVVRGTVVVLEARGRAVSTSAPVVVMTTGDRSRAWREVPVGATVVTAGRLVPADPGSDVAALVSRPGAPRAVAPPSPWLGGLNRVRAGLATATADLAPGPRGLVPALVVGDTSRVDPALAEDFRTTGLTHLTAVSGSNLTLLIAFALVLARWAGVRGLWLRVTAGLVAVVFVLLCRAEPSVLRAAAMGYVALAALSSGARDRRGVRTLAAAGMVLLLLDPWLSRSWGFALSATACAGIIVLARRWTARMTWCPRWVAEAVAVPLSAQLFTQPLVTALAGQVSVVGVLANALAGPLVGPATVLGLLVTLAGVVSPPLARLLAVVASWPAEGIILVARWCARLPGASLAWPPSPVALAVLTAGSLLACLLAGEVLARRLLTLALAVAMVLALLGAPVQPGWPGRWAVASCDVGQGDATVFRASDGRVVLVDTGPEPPLLEHCLTGLGVGRVSVLLLTHDHADHTDGLPAALRRHPALVLLSRTPSANRHALAETSHRAGAEVREAVEGESIGIGDMRIDVLQAPQAPPGQTDGDSPEENDGSLVLRVTTAAGTTLVTGDLEPGGQDALLARGVDVRCDALKVPHHASGHQSPAFLRATRATVALISVGADNTYGHPARRTLDLLVAEGMTVLRTDERGSVVLSRTDHRLAALTQRAP